MDGKDGWFFYVTNQGNLPVEYNVTTSLGSMCCSTNINTTNTTIGLIGLIGLMD
jgi:hypothetical protein